MGVKDQFLQALDEVPEGISGFTDRAIPTFPVVGWPEDVDAAIIAQGQLAANINILLKTFEGLTPVELLLRLGQRNEVMKAMLLAGLQYLSEQSLHDFTILEPEEGQSYSAGSISFKAQITSGLDDLYLFQVEVDEETFSLGSNEEDETIWEGEKELSEGEYEATFTASFGDTDDPYLVEHSVSFSVTA